MKKRFTGNTRLFLGISGIIIAIALIMQIAGVGLNLGIDFTGGSILEYSVGEDYDVNDVEAVLASVGFGDAQITKAAPSEASENLQANLAAATEETASAEEPVSTILSLDKSGIAADGRTDLQIRLVLKDQSADMKACVTEALTAMGATTIKTELLTYRTVTDYGYDPNYTGGYVLEYDMGGEFDKAAVETAVNAALENAGLSVNAISFSKFEEEAVKVETTEESAEEAGSVGSAQAEEAAPVEETAEEPAAETAEEPAAETAEEPAAETAEEPAAETAEEPAAETAEEPAAETAEEPVVEEAGTKVRILIDLNDVTTQVRTVLEKEMVAKYPNFRFVSIDHVSAIAGKDLLGNAVKALLIAFACMLIYIAIRFDLRSGLAALFALAHDVLIMLAFMIFFRAFFQANSSFIAAILTIVGYSINNTIIIFDRIRENVKKPGNSEKPRADIVEESVATTLARTINTTLTTLITLVALYIFGVESIRQFAFPLIVGMLAGTYSSVLLSGQVWAMWEEKHLARKGVKTVEVETAAAAPAQAKPVAKKQEAKPFVKSFKKK